LIATFRIVITMKSDTDTLTTYRDIIAFWPTANALARDIEAVTGRSIAAGTCRQWRNRDAIPPEYWIDVIAAARMRGYPITADLLARLAARKRVAA